MKAEDLLFNQIKEHTENWMKKCGYNIPYDYEGLRHIVFEAYTKQLRFDAGLEKAKWALQELREEVKQTEPSGDIGKVVLDINTDQSKQSNGWVSVNKDNPNEMPEGQDCWAYDPVRNSVDFYSRNQLIPIQIYTHFLVVDRPEPPKQ